MIKVTAGLICVLLVGAAVAVAAGPASMPASAPASSPFDGGAAGSPQTQIDKIVFARLKQLNVQPANLCSDAVFIRRVYLDTIGTLPTEQEVRDFLASKAANKRSALIDRLLERDEFAGYWAMKWSDLLRVKAEFPINLWPNAAQAYHRWIRTSIKENKPYDKFARELLTASGSNFRDPPVNFYRAMQNRQPAGTAQTVALTFMGVRAEKWPKDRLAAMAAFFANVGHKYTSEWKEEIIYFDAVHAATQPAGSGGVPPAFPDGTPATLTGDRDGREVFADWLIDAKNPYFGRCIVNRVWYWLLGRGIVHEPDDIRPDNPPSNPELLAYLERELVASKYDLKHIYRLILNSQTYQLSSIPRSDSPVAAANFAAYPLRRLDAEVLIDAINQITGGSESYSSPIPEPFTFIPPSMRSIELQDGSISSSFLEMFGRASRDTGLASERNNKPSSAQRLYMLNSSAVQRKIDQGRKMQNFFRAKVAPRDTVTQLYLTILSRFPTADEMSIAEAYIKTFGANNRQGIVDIAWALFNSEEFLYRH